MNIACYPGSFDPITKGHLDIIERASKIFDQVIVVIMENSSKCTLFTQQQRFEMIQTCIQGLDNVEVRIGNGLTVDFAHSIGAKALIRGIRAISDYEYEVSQVSVNQMLNPSIETLFMMAKPEYSFISSSTAKEIARYHGDISLCIPDCIHDIFLNKFKMEESV